MQGSESTPENVEVNPVEQLGGRLGVVLSVIVVCLVDLRVVVSSETFVVFVAVVVRSRDVIVDDSDDLDVFLTSVVVCKVDIAMADVTVLAVDENLIELDAVLLAVLVYSVGTFIVDEFDCVTDIGVVDLVTES